MRMQHDATYRSAPPPPLPRRQNAVLRLYDAPVYRDWAFWHTLGWGLLAGISIPTTPPAEPSPLPLWLDTLLAIAMMVAIFGVIPAWLRLLVRRWRWRKQERQPRQVTPPEGAPQDAAPASFPGSLTQRPQTEPVRGSSAGQPPSRSITAPASPALNSHRSPAPSRATGPTRNPDSESVERVERRGSTNQAVWSAELLTHARNTLPHPAARAVRMLQQAHTSKDQYESLLDAAETLAITISVTAAALLQGKAEIQSSGQQNSQDFGHRNLSVLRNAYFGRGAMFGTWTSWLKELRPLATTHRDGLAGLLDGLRGKPDAPGIVEHLNALRAERNRTAHGDKPKSQPESALRVRECAPHVESILERAQFLKEIPWLFTVSCLYQRRSRLFDIVADHAMGDHPDFERRTFTWDRPVGNEIFYVLGPEGPVPLSPFVANLFCTQCQQVEVCYAYKVIEGGRVAVFKSFGRGHEIRSSELSDELRSLPGQRGSR